MLPLQIFQNYFNTTHGLISRKTAQSFPSNGIIASTQGPFIEQLNTEEALSSHTNVVFDYNALFLDTAC